MKLKIKEFIVYIEETFVIVVFLSIFFSSVREYFENYFMCYLFIIFHELSHMFVASLFGIKTNKINIHISGLSINLNNRNSGELKWLFIFLAGPIANVILAVLFKSVSLVYTVNLVLAIINLVPIYPLDGYNILKILLNSMKMKNIEKAQDMIQIMIMISIGILGIYQVIFLHNPSVILMFFYIFIQTSNLRKHCDSGMYQKYYKNITNF